jgi:hypothetical protein
MPRRKHRTGKRARAAQPLYDAELPPEPYAGDVALSLSAQALLAGDIAFAERCLRLAEGHYRALKPARHPPPRLRLDGGPSRGRTGRGAPSVAERGRWAGVSVLNARGPQGADH